MRLLQAFVVAASLGWQGFAAAKDLSCPSLQLMQIDWQGSDKEAMEAAKKAMAAVGFNVTGGSAFSIVGEMAKPVAEGFILTHAKTAAVSNVAMICVASDPMEALKQAQALRTQMEKTPSPGRQVKGSYSAIWLQDAGDETGVDGKPWSKAVSFTWNAPSEAAGIVADAALRKLGFTQIKGGGINPAHSGIKPDEQMTALVTYAPLNETSARVHVLVTGYGERPRTEGCCNELKAILVQDAQNKPVTKGGPLPVLTPVSTQAAGPVVSSTALAHAVDAVVEKELQDGRLPGLAVGVLVNHKLAYVHGYGLAQGFDPDHTAKKAVAQVPVTEKTVFRWGSVIKTVTATTALRLMEEGKLNLEAKVQDYVPSFPAKEDPAAHQPASITLHYLLCHQGGLPHYADKAFLKPDAGFKLNTDDADPMQSLGAFEQSTLMFPPGTKTHYSSYGYMLLSAAIEKAGGAAFVDLVRQEVIQPLALETLAVDHAKGAAAAGHAEGYTRDAAGHVIVRHGVDLAWKTGAGAYASNVKDLGHWAEALLQHKLLKPETYTMAWKHQPLAGSTKVSALGLGFFLGKDGEDKLTVSHNGLADIATCQMTLYPGSGEGVVIMCNCVPGQNYAGPPLGKMADDIRAAAHAEAR
ncbi:MAG: class beta-lactamase-related serine hydrolase [Verrucomicrobiaceae bacterium]|nr:class beta-lactamase-related serine hydrolase [Verrucomicrobiaceae bacterium]